MLMHAHRRVNVRSEAPVKAGAFGLSGGRVNLPQIGAHPT